MKKLAIQYLVRLEIQKLLSLAFFLIGTAGVITLGAGIYFGMYIVLTFLCGIILFRANQETIAYRTKTKTDSPMWDKIILFVFWLFNYFIIYLGAGLGKKQTPINNVIYWLGFILIIFAGFFGVKAMLENTYLESTARLQKDRDQTVCQSGPYKVVRHPSYASIILNCIGLCMIWPSVWVIACAGLITVIMVIRTYLEDTMLQEGLSGYKEYAKITRYRLVPFVW